MLLRLGEQRTLSLWTVECAHLIAALHLGTGGGRRSIGKRWVVILLLVG